MPAAAIQTARSAVEAPLQAARDRRDDLNRHGREHVRRLLGEAQAAVGLPASLDVDPVFAAFSDREPPFGLLVLDHAEQLGEADFAHLSRLADRWVLIGDVAGVDDHRPTIGPSPRRNGRTSPDESFLARLARLLDREPWTIEGDRFVVRLAHLTPDQRSTVTREPVFDRPHIELRVATGDDGTGILAEVAFPAGTPIGEVKQFLVRELDTILLRPLGDPVWHHGDERLTVCWPAAETTGGMETWIELEPGVREKLIGTGVATFTAAITFDAQAGWDAPRRMPGFRLAFPWLRPVGSPYCRESPPSPVRHVNVG